MRRPRRTQFRSSEAGGHRNRPWGIASSVREAQDDETIAVCSSPFVDGPRSLGRRPLYDNNLPPGPLTAMLLSMRAARMDGGEETASSPKSLPWALWQQVGGSCAVGPDVSGNAGLVARHKIAHGRQLGKRAVEKSNHWHHRSRAIHFHFQPTAPERKTPMH